MEKQKRFTIEEIKNYILSQDSLGDVIYNLSEENIEIANLTTKKEEELTPSYFRTLELNYNG